jgi:hypothetical protein
MIIIKTINGKECKIELTKDEMIAIANELDIINIAESVEAYIGDMEEEYMSDECKMNWHKLKNCDDSIKNKFYRMCADEIIGEAEEEDVALTDDLTDIFNDVINNMLECFGAWYETEGKI